jgi:hypothetical protein
VVEGIDLEGRLSGELERPAPKPRRLVARPQCLEQLRGPQVLVHVQIRGACEPIH